MSVWILGLVTSFGGGYQVNLLVSVVCVVSCIFPLHIFEETSNADHEHATSYSPPSSYFSVLTSGIRARSLFTGIIAGRGKQNKQS